MRCCWLDHAVPVPPAGCNSPEAWFLMVRILNGRAKRCGVVSVALIPTIQTLTCLGTRCVCVRARGHVFVAWIGKRPFAP